MSYQVSNYRPEIDGLRCIAVISVILYHAKLPMFPGGYVGVDVFFVISGFLITSIIAREIDRGSFTFVEFYDRRMRRIVPALFAVCLFCTISAWAISSPEQLKDFGQSLVATMGFLANLYFYLSSGYFSPNIHTLPMIHMWSLAVEEQFYLLFPIALLALSRFSGRVRARTMIVVFGLSLWASINSQVSWPLGNFYLPVFRGWELLAGSILALDYGRISAWMHSRRLIAALCSTLGLSLILVPIVLYGDHTVFPGLAALPPVVGTSLVIVGTARETFVRSLLSSRPMVGIGLISYSAYLWHQPLFAFVQVWQGTPPSPSMKLLLIALTLAAAWLSWRFVELPFRDRSKFSRRQIFGWTAAGTGFFLAVGLIFHFNHGFPSRFDRRTQALAATMQPSPERNRCHTEGTSYRQPGNACRYFGPVQNWAVLGDSHGIELGYALAERLKPQGQGIVHLTFSGCQPALTLPSENPGCSAWTHDALSWLVHQRQVTDVLLIYRHNFYLFGEQTQSYPSLPNEHPAFLHEISARDARAAYWRSFHEELNVLVKAGKRVHVVATIPELPTHVEQFVFSHGLVRAWDGYDAAWNRRRAGPSNAQLLRLTAMPGVSVIYPSRYLCDSVRCQWRNRSNVLYFDDNHLSMAGARRVIDGAIRDGSLPIR